MSPAKRAGTATADDIRDSLRFFSQQTAFSIWWDFSVSLYSPERIFGPPECPSACLLSLGIVPARNTALAMAFAA